MNNFAWLLALLLTTAQAQARGVSPYLPVNLTPEIERQIERVLILADKPVMRRPIAAAVVLDALPAACAVDAQLCASVRQYLRPYMKPLGVTHLSVTGAATSDTASPADNRRALTTDATWQASARAHAQITDYVLLSLGATAHPDVTDPAGSVLSVGFEYAQLDVGYRDRWLSPFTSSAMLLSTEARTMPSVSLSNYTPLTRLNFTYEFFLARMSDSDQIAFRDGFTSGHPRLAGVQLAIEPVSGWALGFNRIMQFGGGERGGDSLSDLFRAFFRPSRYDNVSDELSGDEELGNQAAAFTSRFLFPGRVPFAVYFEYAGEDTSFGRDHLLGNSALQIGIDFPQLLPNLSLTYEGAEWQNAWYIHSVYGDGLTNEGRVIGHWGAAHRQRGDGVGAQSHMLRLGWTPPVGGLLELEYRTLENQEYGALNYDRLHDARLRYSRTWRAFTVGAELQAGRDVLGEDYQRVAAYFRYPGIETPRASLRGRSRDDTGTYFVNLGVTEAETRIDLTHELPTESRTGTGLHLAAGVHRAVSERSRIGARIELDDVDGHLLMGVRAVDYARRIGRFDLAGFIGAARYDLATPAYGLYYGLGVRWRDVLPRIDLGMDFKYAERVARDRLLPGEPASERPDAYYDLALVSVYLSRRW